MLRVIIAQEGASAFGNNLLIQRGKRHWGAYNCKGNKENHLVLFSQKPTFQEVLFVVF